MAIEDHKQLVRRWSEELMSLGNLDVADEIVAPDYVRHDPGNPLFAGGPDAVKRHVSMLRGMLPDLTETGDPVRSQNIWTNTLADGTPGGPAANGHCEEWTTAMSSPVILGNNGFTAEVDSSWTEFGDSTCDLSWRLYCFQQR